LLTFTFTLIKLLPNSDSKLTKTPAVYFFDSAAAPVDPFGEADSGQICAVFTFDILAITLNGVTSPTTVTFFAAKSMLKDVTPTHLITNTRENFNKQLYPCKYWVIKKYSIPNYVNFGGLVHTSYIGKINSGFK
jgi:hypothetical protein